MSVRSIIKGGRVRVEEPPAPLPAAVEELPAPCAKVEPVVRLLRTDGEVHAIELSCGCGEVHVVRLEYGGEPADAPGAGEAEVVEPGELDLDQEIDPAQAGGEQAVGGDASLDPPPSTENE